MNYQQAQHAAVRDFLIAERFDPKKVRTSQKKTLVAAKILQNSVPTYEFQLGNGTVLDRNSLYALIGITVGIRKTADSANVTISHVLEQTSDATQIQSLTNLLHHGEFNVTFQQQNPIPTTPLATIVNAPLFVQGLPKDVLPTELIVFAGATSSSVIIKTNKDVANLQVGSTPTTFHLFVQLEVVELLNEGVGTKFAQEYSIAPFNMF